MKLKQHLSLLLALALLIGTLCGCGGNDSTLHDDDDDDRRPSTSAPKEDPTDPTDPSVPTEPSNPDIPSQPTNKINMSQISDFGDFSEGLAFVKLEGTNDKTFCINKKGEIVFTLEGNYNCGTFHNGIAFIYNSMQYGVTNVYICNTEGNLTSPADLGGTAFLTVPYIYAAQPYDCFFGDYILITNTTTTFTGSATTLGIMNNELEYIVEPSEELYELYKNHYDTQRTQYYDGYLYQDNSNLYEDNRYLNLRTGEEGFDLQTMYDSIQIQNPSDLWKYQANYNENGYKDERDNSVQIDLTQYEKTLYKAGPFENGTAPLVFRSEGATGYQVFFTIMDEDGQFQFEPYAISSIYYSIVRENNSYLLWIKHNTREGYKLSMLLFDENGQLKQYEEEFPGSQCFISMADDVIRINTYTDGGYFYYTKDFEPLF